MDKDNNDKSKVVKLDKKTRRMLLSIDKSSKWEDIKDIKDINDEIINLDIYKDFIGLGCSKYLNKAGEDGNIDIEEMFRNCREAEKVRQRIKKKEKREDRKGMKAGKAGLGRSNIGSNNQSKKEISSKQFKDEPKKENVIITKAKEVGKSIKDVLNKSIKGGDWKDNILKLGLSLGLDTLFGIVIGVMEYTIDNPVGGIALTSSMIGLIGSIYAYISETEMGEKIIGNITKWIKGKMNELYDYLMGNDIKVLKKKKKPIDKGGSKKDDDDDDDDDDSSDDYIIDIDELNSDTEDTTLETTEENEIKETPPQQTPQQPEGNFLNSLMSLYQAQTIQQAQQLQNANLEKLFTQNANNPPITTPPITTPPITEPPITTPPITEPPITTPPIIPTETPADTSNYSTYLGGAVAGILGGVSMISSNILGSVPVQPVPLETPIPLTTPIPSNNAESLLTPSRSSRNTQTDNLLRQKTTQTKETSQDTNDAQDAIKDLESKLKAQKVKDKELLDRMNRQIDDIGLRGTAWGAINPFGELKTPSNTMDGLRSIIRGIDVIDKARDSLMMKEKEETNSLLQDVENQALTTQRNAQELQRQNAILKRNYDEINKQLIEAREGNQPDRKMTADEADAIKQQEAIEAEIEAERDIKDFVSRTERDAPERIEIETEEDITDGSLAEQSILGMVGRPPNQDIILIQEVLGLPRQTGTYPSGARKPNEVKFSSFASNTRKLPSESRNRILRLVNNDKLKASGTNRSKISPSVAKEIADILRGDN
jgi:hypothetical protein